MAKNTRQSSSKSASLASKVLASKGSSKAAKSLAGSVLSQKGKGSK